MKGVLLGCTINLHRLYHEQELQVSHSMEMRAIGGYSQQNDISSLKITRDRCKFQIHVF